MDCENRNDFFISVSGDKKHIARKIKNILVRNNKTVWFYDENDQSGNVQSMYKNGIETSKYFIVLLSKRYLDQGNCLSELQEIISKVTYLPYRPQRYIAMYGSGITIEDIKKISSERKEEKINDMCISVQNINILTMSEEPTEKEIHNVTSRLIQEILKLEKLNCTPNQVTQPPPVIARFVPGTSIIKVFIQAEHPLSGNIRDWLEKNIGYEDDDVWEFSRSEYLKKIVPKLEMIYGKNCMPQPK